MVKDKGQCQQRSITKVKVTKALYIKKNYFVLHTRVIAHFEGLDKLNKYYIATYGQK